MQDDDARLMLEVAKGNRDAFAVLFDRHQASVVRFCHRFSGSSANAEELAQDVFIKVFRYARTYQPNAKFKTFLFRVATNHCLNEARRGVAKRELSATPTTPDGPNLLEKSASAETPHETMEAKELERAVAAALMKMSERERAAFSMCRFEGMAYREIAQVLDATEAAVKSLIHRATVHVMNHIDALDTGAPTPGRSVA